MARMQNFLRSFTNSQGIHVYMEAIKMMCTNNEQSIAVGFIDLSNTCEQIAVYLADYPVVTLDILNAVYLDLVGNTCRPSRKLSLRNMVTTEMFMTRYMFEFETFPSLTEFVIYVPAI